MRHGAHGRNGILVQGLGCGLAAIVCLGALVACDAVKSTADKETAYGPLMPEDEPDAVDYAALAASLPPVAPMRGCRIGVVMKTFGNPYWQMMAKGMQDAADGLGVTVDIQAGAHESDHEGQLQKMRDMIGKDYAAIIVSPQQASNLAAAELEARKKGILLIHVNEVSAAGVAYFVSPRQYEAGVMAASYLLERHPQGGKAAVLGGIATAYAAQRRTLGFAETLQGSRIDIVATVDCDWDLQKALSAMRSLAEAHPDLIGVYCNNDDMALGAVQALKACGKAGQIDVIGTDGIAPALEAVADGRMSATVDSAPEVTGRVALEMAVRVLEGQAAPRVVFSAQRLVTRQTEADKK